MRQLRLTRRAVSWSLSVLVICIYLLTSITACTGDGVGAGNQEKVKVTMFCFAGHGQADVAHDVVNRYTEENPHVEIEIIESSNSLYYPKMVATQKITPDEPLINFGYFNALTSARGDMDDMWLPLDLERIPNHKDLREGSIRPDNKGLSEHMSLIGIVYNNEILKDNPPTSWADIWSNPKYEGKIVLWDYAFYEWLIPAARFNGGSETNIDPAFEVWSDNLDMIGEFVTSNEGIKNALVSGSSWLHPGFHGSAYVWGQVEGGPFDYVPPKEGQIAWPIHLQIVKGSTPQQIAVAEDIINELISPENNKRQAEIQCALPANEKAKIPESLSDQAAFHPDAIEKTWEMDYGIMIREDDVWRARWDREIKSRISK